MRDYEELTSEWEELLEVLRCGHADLDAVKHLIFDTYHFLKSDLKGDSIPRNRLELYKYISQACRSMYLDYPLGIKNQTHWRFSNSLPACALCLKRVLSDTREIL